MQLQSASELTGKKCAPCEGGVEPCPVDVAKRQLAALEDWQLSDDGKLIYRQWQMKNFVQAMQFLNRVAEIAEGDQHHPDLHLTGYRQVRIELMTHAIGGLSENDFILAAKIDQAAQAISK